VFDRVAIDHFFSNSSTDALSDRYVKCVVAQGLAVATHSLRKLADRLGVPDFLS